jgi:hypothetical protein
MAADPLAATQAKIDKIKLGANGTAHGDDNALQFQRLSEFIQRPKVSSLVRGIIPARAIIVVYGPPKGGKTFTVCDLTMHGAHGIDWCGFKVPRRLRVAYCAGEGISGLRVRLKGWLEYHDSISEPGEFIILPRALSLPDRVASLVEELRTFKPDIIVTDTLNAYFGGGDENSTQDMSTWCAAVRYLRDELGASIVVIHHSGHGESGRERGSIVLRASADVLIQVAKDTQAGELVAFQVIAARDIETMESPIALKLVRHVTDWLDEDGAPMVSCIVQPGSSPVTLPGRGTATRNGRSPKTLNTRLAFAVLTYFKEKAAAGQVVNFGDLFRTLQSERAIKDGDYQTVRKPLQRTLKELMAEGILQQTKTPRGCYRLVPQAPGNDP